MKPEAFLFADRDGMYAKHCRNKDQAIKAMREELESWRNSESLRRRVDIDAIIFDENTVQETRYRQHRACESETVGDDDTCYECGEPCGTVGRKAYMIWF